ncbi:MAG: patatin-like phospholipase family protein [Nitrospiria bacterium]
MTQKHTPFGAQVASETGPKRALILAGGGMRLSYQAGAVRALFEAGLTFSHVDGTSGGAVNHAMLFSGQGPEEMCDRWRSLNPKDFVSFLPWEKYLEMTDMQAMGDADNIIQKVFPHLGVDVARVRAAEGMVGTFNVCNYTRKINEVIPHERITVDYLVAGMSLPGVLPPVKIGEDLYHDSAFMRDANLMEAVRRGAEELWVLWVLGNTDVYKGGVLGLYVNMLEVSANGALHEEFRQIEEINARIEKGERVYGHARPIKLHLIKPEYPLPLDPDLYFGNVDNATLIDMGYADAQGYLKEMSAEGVPLSPETTRMKSPRTGITFRETMSGFFILDETDPKAGEKRGKAAGLELAMHAAIDIEDLATFLKDPAHPGRITGRIDFPSFGRNIPAKSGVFNLFHATDDPELLLMIYELAFEHEGQTYYLAGKKEVKDDPGFDLWKDTTTLFTQLHKGPDKSAPVVGAGVLTLSVKDFKNVLSTMHVTHAGSVQEKTKALSGFGRFFAGSLWESYFGA